MPLTIGSNVASLQAQRSLSRTSGELSQVLERLSSGARINRASDDAAGLAISSSLNAKRRVFLQGVRNLNDGASALLIGESAIKELAGISTRHIELAEQAANGVYSTAQRSALDAEARSLVDEYNRIIYATDFNKRKLLDGTFTQVRMQAGFGLNGSIVVGIGDELGEMDISGDGTFDPGVNFSGYDRTNAVAAGDVDGDGRADLIVSDINGVSVEISNGSGGFTNSAFVSYGIYQTNVELFDVDGDGDKDIVSSSAGGNGFSVALGNGNGTFKASSAHNAGAEILHIAAADFNGDTFLDLAFADAATNDVGVSLGNGNGTFKATTFIATAAGGLRGVAVGDLNNDSFDDIVTSDYGNSDIYVILGNGNHTYKAPVLYSTVQNSPDDISLGDVDGDGDLDIAVADALAQSISILKGNGNGTFIAPVEYTPSSNITDEVILVDLNGDDRADLVSSGDDGGDVSVFLANSNGTFKAPTVYTAGSGVDWATVGDFTGDGVLDIATANYGDDNVTMFVGNLGSSVLDLTIDYLDLRTQAAARTSLTTSRNTLDQISRELGRIGGHQSRLQVALQNLSVASENFAQSESRIKDADVAVEAGRLLRLQILQQASASVLANANLQPQLALDLLR